MKKLILILALLASAVGHASADTSECKVYLLKNDNAYSRYELIDTYVVGQLPGSYVSELGRPIATLNNKTLHIRGTDGYLYVRVIDGVDYVFPKKIYTEVHASAKNKFGFQVPELKLSINCSTLN